MEPVEKYYIEKNIEADDEKSIIKDDDLSIDIIPETSTKEDKPLKDKLRSDITARDKDRMIIIAIYGYII